MQKQEERVRKYMSDFGGITNAQAMNDLGVGSLSARIHGLRMRGVKIKSVPTKGINRYGEKINYITYVLEEK